ncbi:adenylyl-sulfate kinase [Leptospira levettii]|uniref:Adenylyl-sulfate kinase n=1 Tax=Leptospira levettii TaxID=2023178 RepID=A0ABY2MR62_9LEPT|nr:adenylyl-sulfate kinase [Leptospira levettii]TGK97371.1 adenylyl-sulfate kinase [Leptospira levettii]TGL11729.1 adenylyl-sulfate kinase [Leptospira levettii]TGL23025.1 adenylyl-sulfate kinase [Leptospira levettii]TGL73257.1 adenylyl-sulfate kinase [Leptospira levettii]TGM25931.1 adenylyl-sulfate kinase [Leptospira levettii]
MDSNIVWLNHKVTPEDRAKIKNQKPCMLWLTGLSGSGKSTIANALESYLNQSDYHTVLLDGDNLRFGLNKDLGFSAEDRSENIRRIGEVGKLFVEAGVIVIASLISPFSKDRKMVRDLFSENEFIEVYISTPLGVCESRDPKGLYKKARIGEIPNFTGIGSPYEEPVNPEIKIDTNIYDVPSSIEMIVTHLRAKAIIPAKGK